MATPKRIRGWVTIVTSVVFVIAISAMIDNSVVVKPVEQGRMPRSTTPEDRVGACQLVVGTVRAAAIETRTWTRPATAMPPTRDRGKVWVDRLLRDVGRVLEAGHREERGGDGGEDAEVGVAWAMYQVPMIITMTRPATSTKVIITTDSVMPMKLTTTRTRRNSSDASSAGAPSQSVAKQEANPVASELVAAKLADRNDTVTRKVRPVLPSAFLTNNAAPAAWGDVVARSA